MGLGRGLRCRMGSGGSAQRLGGVRGGGPVTAETVVNICQEMGKWGQRGRDSGDEAMGWLRPAGPRGPARPSGSCGVGLGAPKSPPLLTPQALLWG